MRRVKPGQFGVFLPLLFMAGAVPAQTDVENDRPVAPYEDQHTEKAGKRYVYDIHAWVYTRAFADKFQMPAEWISDDLAGVSGLAYRVEWQTGMKCGFEEAPACRRRVMCVLDAFWESSETIPFRNDLEVNHDSFGSDRSMRWLSPQTREDFDEINALRQSATLAGPVAYSYHDGAAFRFQEINTFQYERRAYDIANVSFQLDCGLIDNLTRLSGPLRIYMGNPGVELGTLQSAIQNADSPETVNRVIVIPPAFFPRWAAHHAEFMAWEPAYHDEFSEAPWWPQKDFEAQTYQARFTDQSSGPYDQDVNIWAYTPGFARRFGMPEEWIEDDLGDAVALAFRVDRDTKGWCGAGYNLKSCHRNEHCMWDIYFPDDAPLPWYVDWPVVNLGTNNDQSIIYLSPTKRTAVEQFGEKQYLSSFIHGGGEEPTYLPVALISGQRQHRHRKSFLGFGYWSDWRWIGGGTLQAWEHERRLSDLQMLSIHGSCSGRGSWEEVKRGKKRQIRSERLLFAHRPSDRLWFAELLQKQRVDKNNAAVEVELPSSFIVRWSDHQTSVHRFGKEVEKAVRKLINKASQ